MIRYNQEEAAEQSADDVHDNPPHGNMPSSQQEKRAMRKQINFSVPREDVETIARIVDRALPIARAAGVDVDRLSLHMDITACHANGCPLKLSELLAADDGNFGHDVFGIRRHMDRTTGHLGGCFLPRYAQPVQS